MLIVPLEKSLDWRRPPVVTFLLVAVNCLVLFGFQGGDGEAFERAFDYYVDSPLPEIEFPRYVDALEERGELLEAQAWEVALAGEMDDELAMTLLAEMVGDGEFTARLEAHEVVTPDEPVFARWSAAHGEFQALLHESVTFDLGFTPSEHRPVTLLTYMFLHGGVAHLVGNMIFLVVVGFALEVALGSLVYLGCYLAAGIAGGLLYWAVTAGSGLPLVGASGAIAGLMGMYGLIFGQRRIRFFYWVVVYFDYVKAPAWVLFPLWLGNELVQLFLTGGTSNVAYVAHIGGLLAGAGLAFALGHVARRVDTDYLDEREVVEDRARRIEEGLRQLGSLQVDRARSTFRSLHREYPEDRAIMVKLYQAEKLSPGSEEHHAIALRILTSAGDDRESMRQASEIFSDYLATAGKPRLDPATLARLALGFARADELSPAERIVVSLLKRRRDAPGLDRSVLALAAGWRRKNDDEKYRRYLNAAARYFPGSEAAETARRALAQG